MSGHPPEALHTGHSPTLDEAGTMKKIKISRKSFIAIILTNNHPHHSSVVIPQHAALGNDPLKTAAIDLSPS